MKTYIFGYGSLLNKDTHKRTFDAVDVIEDVILDGYERIWNAAHPEFQNVAMNIQPCHGKCIKGVVIVIPDDHIPNLDRREVGYEKIDVTDLVSIDTDGPILTYIMHDPDHSQLDIYESKKQNCRDYMDRCLGGVAEEEKVQWLRETRMPFDLL